MAQRFRDILEALVEGRDLSAEEAEFALESIVDGTASSEEAAALLFGMRAKGETVEELTAFVRVMRRAAIPLDVDSRGAVDLCGTGGDGSGTFNISTAAMFVVAGAGVPVLKHGNRSVSSRCGSADVLEKLGVVSTLGRKEVERVFGETGMAFMFAPNFHPAMKYIQPARRALKIRTSFNILGPLLNPADVRRQVIGAYSLDVAEIMIRILENLETVTAYTVHADDGMDEVTNTTTTRYFQLNRAASGRSGSATDRSSANDRSDQSSEPVSFNPAELGIPVVHPKELAGGDADDNAAIIRSIMENRATDAQRDIVLLNGAFGIHAGGRAASLPEAMEIARESLASGAAAGKLREFSEASREALVSEKRPDPESGITAKL